MRSFTLTVLGVALFAGCTGRSLSVRDAREGDVSLVRNREFKKVYFVPFSMAGVALEGAHSEGDKAKWFVHVAAGAQLEMKKRMRGSQVVIVGTGPSDHGRRSRLKRGAIAERGSAPRGSPRRTTPGSAPAPSGDSSIAGSDIACQGYRRATRAAACTCQGAATSLPRVAESLYSGSRISPAFMWSAISWGVHSAVASSFVTPVVVTTFISAMRPPPQ